MDETRLIQCPCGQENQLVLLEGGWHYDEARHGNGEPYEGLCFNCRAPLEDDELFPAGPQEAPVNIVEKPLSKMTKAELFEKVAELEKLTNLAINIPSNATKADIIEKIEVIQQDSEEQ
jgi:hypothetical protein